MGILISFLGDISFNDDYIELYKNKKNPFNSLKDTFKNQDFVIGNLECIAKGTKGENLKRKPRLTTTVETLNFLKKIPVNLVFLAQNHIYDHLDDGFMKTITFLEQHDIKYMGASSIKKSEETPIILEKEKNKIGLLNYVNKDTNPNLPTDAGVFLNMFEIDKAKNDIKKIRKSVNHIVVSLHWGGRVEGGLYPDWDQPKIARQLIDAGADLIIGHHSHTIQPFEIYKGKHIFYSLGNFCFSDYTFEGKFNPMPPRRMITPIINIEFNKKNYSVDIKYFKNELTHFTALDYKSVMNRRNKIFMILKEKKALWKFYFFYKQKTLPFILFFGRKDISFAQKITRIYTSIHRKLK